MRQCGGCGCTPCASCGACGVNGGHYPSCKIAGYDMHTSKPTAPARQPASRVQLNVIKSANDRLAAGLRDAMKEMREGRFIDAHNRLSRLSHEPGNIRVAMQRHEDQLSAVESLFGTEGDA